MLRNLSLDVIFSSKFTVFLELGFSEQITPMDKYLSTFLGQMEAILYLVILVAFCICSVNIVIMKKRFYDLHFGIAIYHLPRSRLKKLSVLLKKVCILFLIILQFLC